VVGVPAVPAVERPLSPSFTDPHYGRRSPAARPASSPRPAH
jgi:hypothetical protein